MSAQQWPCACLFIPPADGLDGIHVFFIDRESSVGYVTVICYGQAWTAFFGAMGGRTIREFFCEAGTDYLVNKMRRQKETKAELKYLSRIIDAVKAALIVSAKEAVPLEECKRRALEYLKAHRREFTKASSVAYVIWPDAEFHAQGAGAAASRILKHLERDGAAHWGGNDHDWGWKVGGK